MTKVYKEQRRGKRIAKMREFLEAEGNSIYKYRSKRVWRYEVMEVMTCECCGEPEGEEVIAKGKDEESVLRRAMKKLDLEFEMDEEDYL